MRALRVRKKEHCDAIRLGQSLKSAFAEHVHEQSMPHEIDWQGIKAIDRALLSEGYPALLAVVDLLRTTICSLSEEIFCSNLPY